LFFRLQKIFIYILLATIISWLAVTIALSSEPILRITGTSFISQETVEQVIQSVEKPYSSHLAELTDAVKQLYSSKGYLETRVETELIDKYLNVDIEEGPLCLVDKVEVEGAKELSASKIIELSGLKSGDVVQTAVVDAGLEQVRKEYINLGYLFASANWRYTAGSDIGGRALGLLTIEVDEGSPSVLGAVQIEGNYLLSNMEIRNYLSLFTGARFDGKKLADGLILLHQEYKNKGYPQVDIKLGDFTLDTSGLLSFRIRINEGQLVRINNLEVQGNSKTRREVILRELVLKEGDIYVQKKVDESLRRLRMLKLFPQDPQITLDNDTLIIQIKEGRYIRLGGAFGYQPKKEETYQPARLVGMLDINLLNIAGTARKLSLFWQSQSEGASSARLKYTEPWFFDSPVYLNLGLGYRKQTEFRRLEGTLGAGTTFQGRYRLEIGGGYSTVKGYTSPSSRKGLVYFLEGVDTTDRPFNPSIGWDITAREELGIKNVDSYGEEGASRMKLPKLEASLWRYQGLSRRLVLASGLSARAVFFGGGARYADEIYYLGGSSGLRGYRDEQFRGEQVGLAILELRLSVSEGQYLFLFADGGYYYLKGSGGGRGYKLGFGGGLFSQTPIGVLGMEYGIGEGGFGGGVIRVSLQGEL